MFNVFVLGSAGRFNVVSIVPWVIVVITAAVAAGIDFRTRRIPNRLTGPLLLGGLLWGTTCSVAGIVPAMPIVSSGLGDSLLGAVVAGLPFFILWMALGSGAGDAKLMMAIGAWLGMKAGLLLLVCTALAGGIVVIGWALAQRRLLATLSNLPRAAVDLTFIARGPGRIQERRELVAAAAAAAAQAESSSNSAADVAPRLNHKLPYAPAIFVGTCVAAARVFFS
jgi:Flp pilus assembly protein protease CpaA